jgi:hypothetical protein
MTIAIPDTHRTSIGNVAQVILVAMGLALAAGLLYIALSDTSSNSSAGTVGSGAVADPGFRFTDEWLAGQAG